MGLAHLKTSLRRVVSVLLQAQLIAMENHCREKVLAAEQRAAETAATAAADSQAAVRKAVEAAAAHSKAMKDLEATLQARLKVVAHARFIESAPLVFPLPLSSFDNAYSIVTVYRQIISQ